MKKIETRKEMLSFWMEGRGRSPEEAKEMTLAYIDEMKPPLDRKSEQMKKIYATYLNDIDPDNEYGGQTNDIEKFINSANNPALVNRNLFKSLYLQKSKNIFDLHSIFKTLVESDFLINRNFNYFKAKNEEQIQEIVDEYIDSGEPGLRTIRDLNLNSEKTNRDPENDFQSDYPKYFTLLYPFVRQIIDSVLKKDDFLSRVDSFDHNKGRHTLESTHGSIANAHPISWQILDDLPEMFAAYVTANPQAGGIRVLDNGDENGHNKKPILTDITKMDKIKNFLSEVRDTRNNVFREATEEVIRNTATKEIIRRSEDPNVEIRYGYPLPLPEEVEKAGYTAFVLDTSEEFEIEGQTMHHCIGGEPYNGMAYNGRAVAISIRHNGSPRGTAYYVKDDANGGQLRGLEDQKYRLSEFFGPRDHKPLPGVMATLQEIDPLYEMGRFGSISEAGEEEEEPNRDTMSDYDYSDEYHYADYIPTSDWDDLFDTSNSVEEISGYFEDADEPFTEWFDEDSNTIYDVYATGIGNIARNHVLEAYSGLARSIGEDPSFVQEYFYQQGYGYNSRQENFLDYLQLNTNYQFGYSQGLEKFTEDVIDEIKKVVYDALFNYFQKITPMGEKDIQDVWGDDVDSGPTVALKALATFESLLSGEDFENSVSEIYSFLNKSLENSESFVEFYNRVSTANLPVTEKALSRIAADSSYGSPPVIEKADIQEVSDQSHIRQNPLFYQDRFNNEIQNIVEIPKSEILSWVNATQPHRYETIETGLQGVPDYSRLYDLPQPILSTIYEYVRNRQNVSDVDTIRIVNS